MTTEVSLLFGVHAHQPAGNFPAVVEDAHERSYGPFLRTLHAYPDFRFAVHFSGWLLEFLLERYPDDMTLLREMVERGQVELFGGGDMEPVLASIPQRDRVSQLRALGDRLERAFGRRPAGAWLTERVWEPTVVPALIEAGIESVTVDDYHFVCAGRELADLTGHFSTEEDGRRLDLFPISEQLRYRIPFAQAADTVRYLESLASGALVPAAIYFDDIEKFGIWPDTYDWVYTRGWLEQFVRGVLASDVVRTRHFAEFRASQPARGIVYLPTTSYIEMGEWSLPAQRADDFHALLAHHREHHDYDRFKAFLRGGIWRNFLSRYDEANWMHKRMLGLSARVHALDPGGARPRLRDMLHRAQANDAYWHGLFGGIYLPHLRRAIWNAVVALERELDAVEPRAARERQDLDLDGHAEDFIRTPDAQVVVRDDSEAAVIEFSHYALAHNFGDTLTRRREHYHRKLDQAGSATAQHDGIASAHDRVAFRHDIRPEDAVPDARARYSFLDAIRPDGTGEPLWPRYARVPGDAVSFTANGEGFVIGKTFGLDGATLVVTYELALDRAAEFVSELNLAMPSCDGFLGSVSRGGRVVGGFGEDIDHGLLTELLFADGVLGGTVALHLAAPARVRTRPCHTVSQSEAGFERIMQAFTVTLGWSLPAGRSTITVRLGATPETVGP
ncbi:MAG: DUF1926 domain-containing protein [Betaproteobacteria bacterium]|nr:DUF1926 domain-containing protein [Betaproteobacteria bacterium]